MKLAKEKLQKMCKVTIYASTEEDNIVFWYTSFNGCRT